MVSVRRFESIVLLIILLSGAVYSAWIFLRPTAEVTLALHQEFFFKDFKVLVEQINNQTCLVSDNFGCKEAVDEPSVLLRITRQKEGTIDFLHLSSAEGLSGQTLGLQVEIKEIDSVGSKIILNLKVVNDG